MHALILIPICGQCKSRKQTRSVRRVNVAPSPPLGLLPSTILSLAEPSASSLSSVSEPQCRGRWWPLSFSHPPFSYCIIQYPPFSFTNEISGTWSSLCLKFPSSNPFSATKFSFPSSMKPALSVFCLLPLSSLSCLNLVLQSLSEISVLLCFFVVFFFPAESVLPLVPLPPEDFLYSLNSPSALSWS